MSQPLDMTRFDPAAFHPGEEQAMADRERRTLEQYVKVRHLIDKYCCDWTEADFLGLACGALLEVHLNSKEMLFANSTLCERLDSLNKEDRA